MDTILDELFSSNTRSKILKLFFRNSEKNFSIKEVADRIRADYYAVRREIFKLESIKILEVKADRTQKLYFLNCLQQNYNQHLLAPYTYSLLFLP